MNSSFSSQFNQIKTLLTGGHKTKDILQKNQPQNLDLEEIEKIKLILTNIFRHFSQNNDPDDSHSSSAYKQKINFVQLITDHLFSHQALYLILLQQESDFSISFDRKPENPEILSPRNLISLQDSLSCLLNSVIHLAPFASDFRENSASIILKKQHLALLSSAICSLLLISRPDPNEKIFDFIQNSSAPYFQQFSSLLVSVPDRISNAWNTLLSGPNELEQADEEEEEDNLAGEYDTNLRVKRISRPRDLPEAISLLIDPSLFYAALLEQSFNYLSSTPSAPGNNSVSQLAYSLAGSISRRGFTKLCASLFASHLLLKEYPCSSSFLNSPAYFFFKNFPDQSLEAFLRHLVSLFSEKSKHLSPWVWAC